MRARCRRGCSVGSRYSCFHSAENGGSSRVLAVRVRACLIIMDHGILKVVTVMWISVKVLFPIAFWCFFLVKTSSSLKLFTLSDARDGLVFFVHRICTSVAELM